MYIRNEVEDKNILRIFIFGVDPKFPKVDASYYSYQLAR